MLKRSLLQNLINVVGLFSIPVVVLTANLNRMPEQVRPIAQTGITTSVILGTVLVFYALIGALAGLGTGTGTGTGGGKKSSTPPRPWGLMLLIWMGMALFRSALFLIRLAARLARRIRHRSNRQPAEPQRTPGLTARQARTPGLTARRHPQFA